MDTSEQVEVIEGLNENQVKYYNSISDDKIAISEDVELSPDDRDVVDHLVDIYKNNSPAEKKEVVSHTSERRRVVEIDPC